MFKKIHLICAARPNFMKIAPLYHVLKDETWCKVKIIHTGQHYDYSMSRAFFEDFNLPEPDYNLNVGSGTHAEQTSQTMIAYEKLCLYKEKPDLVVVVGDVNATLACSITAKKLHIQVAHLEAGLRSYDRTMPEEINRILTDTISDYYWAPSQDAVDNLLAEGIDKNQIYLVGNIMIDTYCMMYEKIQRSNFLTEINLKTQEYALLTLHRPTNVDDKDELSKLLSIIGSIPIKFIMPVHPRTKKSINEISNIPNNIKLIEPQNYVNFMNLVKNACFIVTDSGGVQEETTYLQIPCFTLRANTERPVTIELGSNQLVSKENLLKKIQNPKRGTVPLLWDGQTAKRLKPIIQEIL